MRSIASYGHVRDLPAKDGSVDPDARFRHALGRGRQVGQEPGGHRQRGQGRRPVILATDPDREGEAISWHVLEVLKAKKVLKDKPRRSASFSTPSPRTAILEAMQHPREIDEALVDAYLARRALDYLVGFNLSPVLWRKLPGARSAGRVQSVALRLVCDRELEIEKFVPREYWSIVAHLRTAAGAPFIARLVGADGKKITPARHWRRGRGGGFQDARSITPRSRSPASRRSPPSAIPPRPSRPRLCSRKPRASWASPRRAPCNSPSGFMKAPKSAARRSASLPICEPTASISRRRRSSAHAASSARNSATNYVPKVPRKYIVKAKNAQEAHEAIRPTDLYAPAETGRARASSRIRRGSTN